MQLNWIAYTWNHFDGYGGWNAHSVRWLTRLGVNVHPMSYKGIVEMPGWIRQLAGYDFSKITVGCMTGDAFPHIPGRFWGLTMCESDRVDQLWVDNINTTCERLIVPCQQNLEAFKFSGVRVPIHIIPGGFDPAEFPVIETAPDRSFTFMALGDRGVRKGLEVVWMAFHKAFGGDPRRFPTGEKDVRLLIKSRPQFASNFQALQIADRRISAWRQEVDQMADVFAAVDAVVIPSFGEGWGLPHRQAAAMGIPSIATRWGGLEDGIDHWGIPIEKFKMVKADVHYAKDALWAFPSVDEVAEKMRWIFDHRHEAKANALKAAEWLRANQTWEHSVKKFIELVERYG
jgi:glycosyltransferase involved in cell wall biosynthesis